MSLSVDGIWKAGVWAQTVWADGVWREGGATPPKPPAPTEDQRFIAGGGFLAHPRRRTKKELDEERERYGIPAEVAEVIAAVAVRQAEQPALDEQAKFEELERELELRSIEWEGRYLAVLNEYLQAEITRRNHLAMILILAAAI